MGSPTAAVSGTISEASLRSPTAPLKPAGAMGERFDLEERGAARDGESPILALLEEAEAGDADGEVEELADGIQADAAGVRAMARVR